MRPEARSNRARNTIDPATNRREREKQKMKPIKILGLAALAAMMGMAFIGAGSAMAESTALCAEDAGECPEGQLITHVHEATLAGKKAVLKTSFLTVECDVLFLGVALTEPGGPPLVLGKFTYSNCTNECIVREENWPAEIKVTKTGHETGIVTGEGLVHVNCSGLNCRYNGLGLSGTAKGSLLSAETNGEVKLTEQSTNKESGFLCPSTSKLTITTTPLVVTYLAGANSTPMEPSNPPEPPESTSLCQEDPGKGPEEECPEGQATTHVHETTLTGKKAVLKTSIVTVECDALFLGDALSAVVGKPLVLHGSFAYTNCGSCTVTEENGPAEINVLKEDHETASVTGEGLVHVECTGLNCRYNGAGLEATAKGALLSTETNGEVKLTEQPPNKESGLFCPSISKLTFTTTPLEATYIGK